MKDENNEMGEREKVKEQNLDEMGNKLRKQVEKQ